MNIIGSKARTFILQTAPFEYGAKQFMVSDLGKEHFKCDNMSIDRLQMIVLFESHQWMAQFIADKGPVTLFDTMDSR